MTAKQRKNRVLVMPGVEYIIGEQLLILDLRQGYTSEVGDKYGSEFADDVDHVAAVVRMMRDLQPGMPFYRVEVTLD